MLCPELIGRDEAIGRLRARMAGLADGGGGVVAVVGEAGMGKSRLTDAVLSDAEALTLSGRAVPAANPTPYRALTDALLAATRGRAIPSDPSLVGFEGHLSRLVPSWGADTVIDDSPVLIGEAVARLLTVLAGDGTVVLLLEDIHWADPETMAVIEYLGDALRDQPVLCVCTTRPTDAVEELLERLERRDPADVERIGPLGRTDVEHMVAACLATTDPPAGLSEFVLDHSDGNPFLVEELLAGSVAAGALRNADGHWEAAGPLTPAVPMSLRSSIQRRLATLDPVTRRVLGAASLLGRLFEWDVLPGIADVDGRAAVDALRSAVDAQLIEVDGNGFRFRHALTREAILEDLLPPERRELAARAWPAIERAHPGLPGPVCQLAADLAEAAGDGPAAAERLVECAHVRAFAAGALATAEATARRAAALADRDLAVGLDADEVLVHVLAAAGKSGEALAVGRDLAERLARSDASSRRLADLLVALVRAALAAGDLDTASVAASDARVAAGPHADAALLARIDAVGAEVALDRADLEHATELSHRSIDGARATDQPAVLCEALLTLGRITRPSGVARAHDSFQEAADVAEAAGLARWHLRAQQELALERFMVRGTGPLRETRDLAARYGAHLTVAAMDLMLADAALSAFDADACFRAATACSEASSRYGLAAEPVAQLWLAGAHALSGDDDAMQLAIDASLARDRDDPRILGDLYGRVLVTRAFVRDELDTLPGLTEQMMEHVRRAPPTTSIYPGRVLWVLLRTMADDDLGATARAEYRETTEPLGMPLFGTFGEVVDAVALGRAGDADSAQARIDPAFEAVLSTPASPGMIRAVVLIVAEAAIRDGWGDPVRWLRETEAWFAERRFDRLARRSRTLLGQAGAPVPRRGRGASEVPASLRALGVTSREVDVLKLVVDGRTNKEIAAELYLSPKTVERHLSSLFDRTGVRNRQALAEVGVTHLA